MGNIVAVPDINASHQNSSALTALFPPQVLLAQKAFTKLTQTKIRLIDIPFFICSLLIFLYIISDMYVAPLL